MFPAYSERERFADAAVHVAGIIFGSIGAITLLVASIGALPLKDVFGLAIYGFGLVTMFTASASYHWATRPALKAWLRRIDHAAIFIMIAGSYTPFALSKIGGSAGYWLLSIVWGIALAGVYAKLRFPQRLERVSIFLYLAQGWAILLAVDPLIEAIPAESFTLLLAGGCIYTLGVVFHLLTRLPYHNVIWHIFVLAGAICQFASIYGAVIP